MTVYIPTHPRVEADADAEHGGVHEEGEGRGGLVGHVGRADEAAVVERRVEPPVVGIVLLEEGPADKGKVSVSHSDPIDRDDTHDPLHTRTNFKIPPKKRTAPP